MALSSTVFNFTIELSDIDRGVYETLELKVAQHPSETSEYMLARVLAYALEYEEGIEFTAGLSSGDDPAIVVKDLTGRVRTWIEVGLPDADRLHRASKAADRVAVYTHRDIRQLLGMLEGRKIHRREELEIFVFDKKFISEVVDLVDRRTRLSLSITERHLYLDIGGKSFESVITKSPL